jgi:prohibitin 1
MASQIFGRASGIVGRGLVLLGLGVMGASQCVYDVEPGHRAVIFNRVSGIENKVRHEGMHLMIPIVQRPIIIDVRTQPRVINTETGTKDLQNVHLSLRVLARPNIPKLPQLYQKLGVDFLERVLPSVSNEVLKQVVAQYDADQLLTMRERVSQTLRESLIRRCLEFDIDVDDVSITHLEFSKDFSKAIEDKQVAEQMAERAKFVVMKAEQEKQALVVKAEGDAEAAQLVSDAIHKHGTGLIEIRRLETATQIAESLSRAPNVAYLPSGGNLLLNVQSAYNSTPNRAAPNPPS